MKTTSANIQGLNAALLRFNVSVQAKASSYKLTKVVQF